MSIAIDPEAVAGTQSIQTTVSQLGAGFRRMRALGAELATLDAVSQDIRHTQAMIRRDVANTVLQTAFSVKTSQEAISDPRDETTPIDAAETVSEAPVADRWAKRLLRWADQLGRDLFGLSGVQPPALKESRKLLPSQKP